MQTLVLGSSSPFRAELLAKLQLPFVTASPDIDEQRLANEAPSSLVERLAQQKAKAIATNYPDALIIGSDQVAVLNDQVLGKPCQHNIAVSQLRACSGKTVRFLTGLALYNAKTHHMQSVVEPFDVVFRSLSEADIEAYLHAEQPYQCAGSFKSEGLGITLFEKLQGNDPNSLIGLPLIRLVELLANEQVNVLQSGAA